MHMYTRIAIYITLVVAIVFCANRIVSWHSQLSILKTENTQMSEALKRAQAARKRDEDVLARAAEKNAATARKKALAGASVASAVAANPDWASTPVPKEIQDALPGT
jgi:ABC-type transporter MlaC component